MIVISVVLLSWAISNIALTIENVQTTSSSLEAVDESSTMRLLLRSLANINLDYMSNKSPYFDDRSLAYENLISNKNDDLRDDSNFLESITSKDDDNMNILNWFISSKGAYYT